MIDTTAWIKSSFSGPTGGNCVEVRGHAGQIEVRDTKQHGNGPSLRFTSAEFAAWVDGAKQGEFDHLIG
jgi:hypothetical protein